jgi:hypothetical protein
MLCEIEEYATFINVLEVGENIAYGLLNVCLRTVVCRQAELVGNWKYVYRSCLKHFLCSERTVNCSCFAYLIFGLTDETVMHLLLSDTKFGINFFSFLHLVATIAVLSFAWHAQRGVPESTVICSGNPSCDVLLMRDKSFGKRSVKYVYVLLVHFVHIQCSNMRKYLVSLLTKAMAMIPVIYLFI